MNMDGFDYKSSDFEQEAELLKTLAHPVRLCIVKSLIKKGACNVSTMYTCLEMPQSTISQHLGKLKQANVVKAERDGLEIYYKVENPVVIQMMEILFKDEE